MMQLMNLRHGSVTLRVAKVLTMLTGVCAAFEFLVMLHAIAFGIDRTDAGTARLFVIPVLAAFFFATCGFLACALESVMRKSA